MMSLLTKLITQLNELLNFCSKTFIDNNFLACDLVDDMKLFF